MPYAILGQGLSSDSIATILIAGGSIVLGGISAGLLMRQIRRTDVGATGLLVGADRREPRSGRLRDSRARVKRQSTGLAARAVSPSGRLSGITDLSIWPSGIVQ